jgi:hypothetical protein
LVEFKKAFTRLSKIKGLPERHWGESLLSNWQTRVCDFARNAIAAFAIGESGYANYRVVASNMAFDVYIEQGIRIVGNTDGILLRYYREPKQALQVVVLCSKNVFPIETEKALASAFSVTVERMLGEPVASVMLYDVTTPSVTDNLASKNYETAITLIRNVAKSIYVDSLYYYQLGTNDRCKQCAYQQLCQEQSFLDLIKPIKPT